MAESLLRFITIDLSCSSRSNWIQLPHGVLSKKDKSCFAPLVVFRGSGELIVKPLHSLPVVLYKAANPGATQRQIGRVSRLTSVSITECTRPQTQSQLMGTENCRFHKRPARSKIWHKSLQRSCPHLLSKHLSLSFLSNVALPHLQHTKPIGLSPGSVSGISTPAFALPDIFGDSMARLSQKARGLYTGTSAFLPIKICSDARYALNLGRSELVKCWYADKGLPLILFIIFSLFSRFFCLRYYRSSSDNILKTMAWLPPCSDDWLRLNFPGTT